MPEQLTQQEKLFGEREEEYGQITIPNKKLFPFVDLLNSLVSESKVRYSDGALYSKVVDPANVGMIEVEMDVAGGLDELELGVPIEYLRNRLQNKPRSEGNSIDVTLDLAYPHSTIQVDKEYSDIEFTRTDRMGLIDPGMVRDDPDMPDLEYEATATLPLDGFRDTIKSLPEDKHLEIKAENDKLHFGQKAEGGVYRSLTTVEGDFVEGEAVAMYSNDYFEDVLDALKRAKVNEVELEWDDEFPIQLSFETEYLSGLFVLAPRIQSGPEDR